jgi:hypothetical protein
VKGEDDNVNLDEIFVKKRRITCIVQTSGHSCKAKL